MQFVRWSRAGRTEWTYLLVMAAIYTTAQLGLASAITDDVEQLIGRPATTTLAVPVVHVTAMQAHMAGRTALLSATVRVAHRLSGIRVILSVTSARTGAVVLTRTYNNVRVTPGRGVTLRDRAVLGTVLPAGRYLYQVQVVAPAQAHLTLAAASLVLPVYQQ